MSSSSSNGAPPYIQRLYHKIMTEKPTTTKGLENKYIVSVLVERLNETGELGTVSKDQLNQLEGVKGAIRHELSTKTDRSIYGNDIVSGIYSPTFNNALIDIKKRFVAKHATDMDKYLSSAVEFEFPTQGGKRSKRKGKQTRKSRGKKSKSNTRRK